MKALHPFKADGTRSLMLWADDFEPHKWLSVCRALGLPEDTMEIELRVKIIAAFDHIHGGLKKKTVEENNK